MIFLNKICGNWYVSSKKRYCHEDSKIDLNEYIDDDDIFGVQINLEKVDKKYNKKVDICRSKINGYDDYLDHWIY